jgi:hypothetical protein
MFSTASVDAARTKLWTSTATRWRGSALRRRGEFLRSVTASLLHRVYRVFHSACGRCTNKAVEKYCNSLVQQCIGTSWRNLAQLAWCRCAIARGVLSTADVDASGKSLWIGVLSA